MRDSLRVYAIYDSPKDMPGMFVVRAHNVEQGEVKADPGADAFHSLQEARAHCQRLGLVCMQRHPDDDPVIVETWL
jgi:hypothetical protein